MQSHPTLSLIILFFLICFSDILSAQNMEKETVIVPNKSWDLSKESEIEHYKNYSPDIISEYFILGTLRYFNVRKEDQVDWYQDYEEPLVNYLRAYIYEKFRFSLRKEQ